MSAERQPIVVGINQSPGAEIALRWALTDAHVRDVAIRLIYAYRWRYTYGRIPMYADVPVADLQQGRYVAEQLIANTVDRARELDADVDVAGEAVDGDPAEVLVDESAFASLLVLGSRHLKAVGSTVLGSVSASASARSTCPAVVVRGPAGLPAERPAVVVGVDGTDASEPVLEFAFEHASRHQVPLRAVLCWHPDLLATMMWRAEPPAPASVEGWLAETVAGWREKFPDVEVHTEVIREHPADGLVLASLSQHLVVVGSHGHHALTGTLLGSVSQAVLHHATCPVAVVPTHRN